MKELKHIFPKDFLWGVATASYQIEGAYKEGGKGESIWDRFSHIHDNIFDDHNGDIACDHYHLYEEDVKLLKEMGVQTYRFSISWPRIFPEGRGNPNEKGVEFYRNLISLLNKYGIKPAVTLYHWDLPQKLQDIGGWANREVVNYYVEYASYIFEEFGQSVPIWITHNEPWVVSFLGYGFGVHAPGIKDISTALLVSHHLMLSHGRTVKLYRKMGLKGQIGITLNLSTEYSNSNDENDIEAARNQDGFANRWFLDPLLKGNYPKDILELFVSNNLVLPQITQEDLEEIYQPIDFLGVNYYSAHVNKFDANNNLLKAERVSTGRDKTEMGWEIYPEGLYDLLIRLHKEYGGIPLMITENGAAFNDIVDYEGKINDYNRLDYLYRHFREAHKAINDGVNLKGYYVWSFMDNFEWTYGYSKRFGITYIDYKTKERILKKSGYWYGKVIKNNGF
ncbi:MAG: beta-glucosidase [Epulopiscium sp.]|nr:beta-glucosidase [Candidatus Epulonipiscium sp.]